MLEVERGNLIADQDLRDIHLVVSELSAKITLDSANVLPSQDPKVL